MPKRHQVPKTEVERIVDAFGGIGRFHRALHAAGLPVARSTVYRVVRGIDRGANRGTLPPRFWKYIPRAARLYGVVLDEGDEAIARIMKCRPETLDDLL